MSTMSLNPSISGPSGFSGLWQLFQLARTPIEFAVQSAHDHGDVMRIKIGPAEIYQFNHPDLIADVLGTHNQNFVKDISYRALAGIFGEGLLLSDGELWQRHRRLMQPAFTQDRIADYAATATEHTATMLDTWAVGDVIKVHQAISQLTIKVITQALFGINVAATALEIGEALDAIMLQYYHRAQTNFLMPAWVPTLSNRQANRATQRLKAIVADIIAQRQRSPQTDLLSSLLLAADENGQNLTPTELQDEVMTLLLAGHETTANALVWTLMLLSQNPDAATKLTAEVQSVLNGRWPNMGNLAQLRYTEQVLKESMRLYPPAWILSREVTQDCKIGPYFLSKGTMVYFSQWVVHRDERFFKSPEQFQPERWQDNLEQRLPRCAYFPFGAGPRVCIGKAFAMMEAILMLAMIAQRFRLELLPDQTIELLPSITLRPKVDIQMVLKPV